MKKTLLLISSIFFFFLAFGNEISIEEAKLVAENYISQQTQLRSSSNAILSDAGDPFTNTATATRNTSTENRELYIFNIDENKGFVIVAGDDAATPILGYANKGNINTLQTPQNVVKWLETYRQQVKYIKTNNVQQTKAIKALWDGESSQLRNTQNSVSPLLSTEWNQAPYVNALCPYDNSAGELTVAGCPATAMAQIMKYWKYPATGSGFHSYQHDKYGTLSANFGATTYDWDAMPNTIYSANNAVATLMYHCGVAVETVYGISSEGGSGSYVIKSDSYFGYPDEQTVEYALPTYFGYATTIEGLEREDYSDTAWKNILKEELDASRPIQYAGYGQGGHTFVCDGYDENDYFHMNWGWGGYYDGFFLLDNLAPGSGGIGAGAGTYNDAQQALIGIKPANSSTNVSNKLEISKEVEIDDASIEYGAAFTVSTEITNDGTVTFNGNLTAAVFDNDNVFIEYIDTKTAYSLGAQQNTNTIAFSTDGMLSLVPGNYTIYIYQQPTDGNWELIKADSLDTTTRDFVELEVVNENDISLYSTINLTTNPIYSNGAISLTLDIANFSSNEFTGTFDISLYNLEGDFETTIEEKTEMTLSAQSHYSDGLTFSSENVDVTPGTYLLALMHKTENGNYELTGSSADYINPIKVIVEEAPTTKDRYEDNNSEEDAYLLTTTYSSNSTSTNTSGSNLHIGTDLDFYAIYLASGYDYEIDINLQDSYSNSTGEYTIDGRFRYSIDGNTWSDTFDDTMDNTISSSGDKTLYCEVSPYFAGETGSYLLNVSIDRTVVASNNEIKENPNLSIYPNPCKNTLTISGLNNDNTCYQIFDINGNVLRSGEFERNLYTIDMSSLSQAVYFIEITSSNTHSIRKFIKK